MNEHTESLNQYLSAPPDSCGKAIQRFLLTGMDIVPACTRLAASELNDGQNPTIRRAKLLAMAKVQMPQDMHQALLLSPSDALRHALKLQLEPIKTAGVALASQLADLPANQFVDLKRRCLLHGAWTEPYLKFQQDIELATFALRDIPLDPVVTTEPGDVRERHHWQLLGLLGNSDRTRREALASILHKHRTELQSNVRQINEAAAARRSELKQAHESAINEPGCVDIGAEFFDSDGVRRKSIEEAAEGFLDDQDLDPSFQLGRSTCRQVLLCVGISDVPQLKWSALGLAGPDAPRLTDEFVDEFIASGRLRNGSHELYRYWRLAEVCADHLGWISEARDKRAGPKPQIIVVSESGSFSPTTKEVKIQQFRSAYLEQGSVGAARAALANDGIKISQSTAYEYMNELDGRDTAWRQRIPDSGSSGIPEQDGLTRKRPNSKGKRSKP